MISLFENNHRRPTEAYARKLEQVLGLKPGALNVTQEGKPKKGWPSWKKPRIWKRFCPNPRRHILERTRANWVRLRQARRFDPALYDWCMRRISRPVLSEFLRYVACDSGPEMLMKLLCMALGALVSYVPISRLGWTLHPILVESTEEVVGHKYWPVLVFEEPLLVALFPQVPLKTPTDTFRVDFLACVRTEEGCRWVHVEVDGPRHDTQKDKERAEAIGLPRVKLRLEDVRASDFKQRLMSKILEALR